VINPAASAARLALAYRTQQLSPLAQQSFDWLQQSETAQHGEPGKQQSEPGKQQPDAQHGEPGKQQSEPGKQQPPVAV
jgi:hypothetical protein